MNKVRPVAKRSSSCRLAPARGSVLGWAAPVGPQQEREGCRGFRARGGAVARHELGHWQTAPHGTGGRSLLREIGRAGLPPQGRIGLDGGEDLLLEPGYCRWRERLFSG